jgi:hypothetical protein
MPRRVLFVCLLTVACASPPPEREKQADKPEAPAIEFRPAGPPVPFEDEGACPFEGCTYREWTAKTPVTALSDRRDDAQIAFELTPGDRVMALTGVVVTVTPGLVEFTVPTNVQTREGILTMQPGETLHVLTRLGEGFVKAWARGRLYHDVDASGLKASRPPEAIWWVKLRNSRGQVGWTRHPEAFDGKDALALRRDQPRQVAE